MASCWSGFGVAVIFAALLMVHGPTSATPSGRALQSCGKGRTAPHAECCRFYDILDVVQTDLFNGGQCNKGARQLMFHDAISYSTKNNSTSLGGGADGSIVEHAEIETSYPENVGLDLVALAQRRLAQKHDVPYGDLLFFAGAVGLSNCPGAPRLHFFVGRNKTSTLAPNGLVPAPFHSVDTILARMRDAGLSPEETVILLASHSIGTQHAIDPTVDGISLDSTPNEFDSQFYLDTALKGTYYPGNGSHRGEAMSPSPHHLRLHSDYALARDPRTSCTWQSYINNQEKMNRDFVKVMSKLSVLGQDSSRLVDCSDIVPVPKPLPWSYKSALLPNGKTVDEIGETMCAGRMSS